MGSVVKTVDACRVAAGRSIYCPYCGRPAAAETVSGRRGIVRKRVRCTELGCDRLNQVVEIDEATGEAVTMETGLGGGLFKSKLKKPSTKNRAVCLVAGCESVTGASCGMCSKHYQRWLGCGRPGIEGWIGAGGLSKAAWLKWLGEESVAGGATSRGASWEEPPAEAGSAEEEVDEMVGGSQAGAFLENLKAKEDDDAGERAGEGADERGVGFVEQAGGSDDGGGAAELSGADGLECVGGVERDGDPAGDDSCGGASGDDGGARGVGSVSVGEVELDVSGAGEAGEVALGGGGVIQSPAEAGTAGEVVDDDVWVDARLATLVALPVGVEQVVVGLIGSQVSVLTLGGKVLWQCEVSELVA